MNAYTHGTINVIQWQPTECGIGYGKWRGGRIRKVCEHIIQKMAPEMFGKGAKRYIVSFDARNVRRTRRLICCTWLHCTLPYTCMFSEEFIKQGGVWEKEVSGKSEDVPGLVDDSVLH